jgi:general secretion pathway protein G
MKRNDRKYLRPGFTLVEMLVVMLIIAVLVSLLAGVVVKVLAKGPEVQRRSDISQMESAVGQFKAKFNVEYMPSRFALRSYVSQYQTGAGNQLEVDSLLFLKRMFTDRVGTNSAGMDIPLAWNGAPLANNQVVVLSGDQCLVFFLGGIVTGSPPDCQGFSTDLRDPTSGTQQRNGPFFKFESKRLAPGANGFYSYNDPYGTAYAYFSAYKRTNGYYRYNSSDCSNLNVSPYETPNSTSTNRAFYNPNTFQIISAGKDGKFGPGGSWSPGGGNLDTQDDMSNFYDALLGTR